MSCRGKREKNSDENSTVRRYPAPTVIKPTTLETVFFNPAQLAVRSIGGMLFAVRIVQQKPRHVAVQRRLR